MLEDVVEDMLTSEFQLLIRIATILKPYFNFLYFTNNLSTMYQRHVQRNY